MFDGTFDPASGGGFGDPGPEPLDPLAEPGLDPAGTSIPASFDPVSGADEAALWQPQEVNGLCAPTSVAMVVSEFTGGVVDKDDVAATAEGHGLIVRDAAGWGGMTAGETEQLLELYGIPSHVEQGDVQTLCRYLDENRGVILAVDSGEVWGTESGVIGDADVEPDHALVVTEIDHAAGTATLNDPGDPAGAGREIPLAVLTDAWADSSNMMVVTDAAPGDSPSVVPDAASPDASGWDGWVILPIALAAGGAAALWLSRRPRRRREHEPAASPDGPRLLGDGRMPGDERLTFGSEFVS
ncbi:MAG: C39 family peptidase [Dehalococcoidia bacterium]